MACPKRGGTSLLTARGYWRERPKREQEEGQEDKAMVFCKGNLTFRAQEEGMNNAEKRRRRAAETPHLHHI